MPKRGGRDLGTLHERALALPLKDRLRLMDALAGHDRADREDGISFSLRSVSELKRFHKAKTADAPIVDWIRGFQPGDVFFDIGANTGGLSLLSGVAHRGQVPVWAFEPAFDNFEALVRNVFANGLESVITPLQVALLDQTGMRPFYYRRRGAGSASHAVGHPLDFVREPFEAVAVQPVMAFRLDDLVDAFNLPAPTRVKIDVDGSEDKVIAGAERVLTTSRCELLVELAQRDESDTHIADMAATLARLGYSEVAVIERRPTGTYPRAIDALFRRS